jgi:hypothetical protein
MACFSAIVKDLFNLGCLVSIIIYHLGRKPLIIFSICRYFSEEPEYPVVVYHENHVNHPVTERPRPTCGPSPAASVIVNSLPASSTPAAARYPQQQQQQRTISGGNQSVLHSEFQSFDSDNSSSNKSNGTITAVKFSPDFRNQLYESLDAASLAAHGILGKQRQEQQAAPPNQQQAFSKTRRSADGLYGGPMQQAAPHVADYDRGYENNRKTTCLLYLQVRYWNNFLTLILAAFRLKDYF